MSDIDQLIDDLLTREGGYVNDARDSGGETNFGITVAVARSNGYPGAMRDMPRSIAAEIYKRLYWLRPRFNDVATYAPKVAAELFDTGVNMGPTIASTFLQRALTALNRSAKDYPDLTPDGKIGEQSLNALEAFTRLRGPQGESVLLKALNALQGERYIRLAETSPKNEAFLYGWLANRL